jgi:hypothetical protein
MRVRRRGGWRHPSDENDATWKLLWAIAGAVAFTAIMFFLNLI